MEICGNCEYGEIRVAKTTCAVDCAKTGKPTKLYGTCSKFKGIEK
jgi:hypothetical protein